MAKLLSYNRFIKKKCKNVPYENLKITFREKGIRGHLFSLIHS